MENKKSGVELIAEERKEQIEKHRFTTQHDLEEFGQHGDQLGLAIIYLVTGNNAYWPLSWERYWKERLDKKTEIEKLAVIGALAAAKIDRLQTHQP